MKKAKLLLSTLSLIALTIFVGNFYLIKNVSAATDNLSTAITWDGSCGDAIDDNGSATAYAYFASGDTVNLTVNNNSSQNLEIGLKGQSPTPVLANSSAQVSISLGSEADAQVSGSCGATNASNLYIFGESGSTTCSVSGKVWSVTVDYDYVGTSVSLYRGSSFVDGLNDTSGGPGGGNINTTVQFAGQSSPETYYVYNGSDSSSPLIGQATCPGVATTTGASDGGSSTSNTSATANSKTTATPAKTTTSNKSATNKLNTTPLFGLNSNYKTPNHSTKLLVTLLIIAGLLSILTIVSTWKVFNKASRPGWAAIIPVYNLWVLLEIGDYQGWWALLSVIPVINIIAVVFTLLASIRIAKHFGKSTLFGVVGLFLFGFVGYTMLAFSKAKYTKKTEDIKPKEHHSKPGI